MRRTSEIVRIAVVACSISSIASLACAAQAQDKAHREDHANQLASFSSLPSWDDGLCEMSYFRATDRIYGETRSYTRVILLNRQWMDAKLGVKTQGDLQGAVPVFKLNVVEEIPTENYNYRFQTTVFLTRPNLNPFKMVVSSQEWCGTSYKQLRWTGDTAKLTEFSYFPDEGTLEVSLSGDVVPYEALPVIAREVAAKKENRSIRVLMPLRSTHHVMPQVRDATLEVTPPTTIQVPLGTFEARRVKLSWQGVDTFFDVEAKAPFRLLRYQMGELKGELMYVERRAYWDGKSKSGFYPTGQAP